MLGPIRHLRKLWIVPALLTVLFLLLYGIGFFYEMPGGYADWRMSRNTGMTGTIKIPLGPTPVEALRKFRRYNAVQVVHQEPVDGGVLLFTKRFYEKQGHDLEVDYIRKTWMGWKWGMGGMYGGGDGDGGKLALEYMVMPRTLGISTPFPMVFGDILDPSIQQITITAGGANPTRKVAKIAGEVSRIWFVDLPASSSVPFEVQAFDGNGKRVADKMIVDPHDSGKISISEGND